MPEIYPADAELLDLETDSATGVEYIPTGRNPYFLEFRRLVQRTLLATQRANDLRIYPDGPLSVGLRPGTCSIGGTTLDVPGVTGFALPDNSTTDLWLDAAGGLQSGPALPTDPTARLPLARAVTAAGSIAALTDLRGGTFLQIPSLAGLNITVTVQQVNQALDGIASTVTAAALNTLTAGPTSDATPLHTHAPPPLAVQYAHAGPLIASQTSKLMGAAPFTGQVVAVFLSVGRNTESLTATDGVSATVKVNGNAVTTTAPRLAASDGANFRSTAQGHGTPAAIKTDGTQNVTQGDVLTVDLARTLGTQTVDATDVVVGVVIRPD